MAWMRVALAVSSLALAACSSSATSAPAGDGSLPSACTKAELRESFDRADWPRRWDTSQWQSPPTATIDGLPALDLDLGSSRAQRSIALSLGEPCHVVVSAMIKVVAVGTGEIDLFEIVDNLGANRQGVFLFGPPAGGLAVEGPQAQPVKVIGVLDAWTPVSIDVDPAQDQYKVMVGAESFSGSLHGTKTLYLSLGAPYVQGAAGWRVVFAGLVVKKG